MSPPPLVGSYPTVSPLPSASPEMRCRRSVFCATVRRLSPPPSWERPALRCPDFPRGPEGPRGHPACTPDCTPAPAAPRRPCRIISHSGQRTTAPSCSTNSPHTGHSSDAPRRSANSTCSSDRCSDVTAIGSQLPEHSDDLAQDLHV